VSAYDGLFLQAWFDRSFDPAASGRHFLEVLLKGMAASPKLPSEGGRDVSGEAR
jgi:hypothetical protein